MEVVAKSGQVYTDEDFERLGQLAESGAYFTEEYGPWGDWIVRPVGRPKDGGEELVSITVKMASSARDEVDAVAKRQGQTRSEFVREVLFRAVREMMDKAAVL